MIHYLIPDMPKLSQLTPYLEEIDSNKWYSNFGPLQARLRQRIASELFNDSQASDQTRVIDEHNVATCSSGTSAIALALRSLDTTEHEYVLVPSFTFPGTISAVLDAGFKPLLCDVDPKRWMMTPEIAAWYVERFKLAAVLPVAAFGVPVDVEAWGRFQQEFNVPVVVDAAAALAQQSLGDLTLCFSLHATKMLGAGEGGLVVSKNRDRIDAIKTISNFGFSRGEVTLQGTNSKLSEYHAAVALAQLDRVNELLAVRQNVYKQLVELLQSRGRQTDIALQETPSGYCPSSFVVKFSEPIANRVSQELRKRGVESRQLYCPALHEHKGLAERCPAFNKQLSVSEQLSVSTLALPFHNFLSNNDVKFIEQNLFDALEHNNHKRVM